MDADARIRAFLDGTPFAVVGASSNREKYGNKVFRAYLEDGREAFAVNPKALVVEGLKAYPDLASVPRPPHGVSVVVPPPVTERVVEKAIALGVAHLWMQPGAESEAAVQRAEEAGINTIAGGPCLLRTLGFSG